MNTVWKMLVKGEMSRIAWTGLLPLSSMRPPIVEWLQKAYNTLAEPLPEASGQADVVEVVAGSANDKKLRRRGKRPRHLFKVSEYKGYAPNMKFLPPGTIGNYYELCKLETGHKFGRKLFCAAPRHFFSNAYRVFC